MKKYFFLIIVMIISASLFGQTAPAYTSLAVGTNSQASGTNSFATGNSAQAGGQYSFAMGNQSFSSGNTSIVMGNLSRATADNAIAIGSAAWATGKSSLAIGNYVSTNGKTGSFSLGDFAGNTTWTSTPFGNDADNQMMMRFAGGYRFHLDNSKIPFTINPNGTVGIDHSNLNNGAINNAGLIFGNASGEGIASKRTGGGNQYGLDFYTGFANRMSLTNSGNLGLGSLTPSARFSLGTNGEELLGTAPSKIFKTYSGVLGTNAGAEIKLASFGFKSGNWTSLGITAYRFNGADGWQNAAILFGYDVDNTPGAGSYFALAGNGNFGIGTAAPGAKLHVMGNIVASGSITPSDIRYKKDIHPINDALKKIINITGVYYSLRTDEFPSMQFERKQQVGLIAQEVEKVLPEVVVTMQDNFKALDYPKLIPLLIQGMKEQQQQIEELKKLVLELIKK